MRRSTESGTAVHRVRSPARSADVAQQLEDEVRATEMRLLQLKAQLRENQERFQSQPYVQWLLDDQLLP